MIVIVIVVIVVVVVNEAFASILHAKYLVDSIGYYCYNGHDIYSFLQLCPLYIYYYLI